MKIIMIDVNCFNKAWLCQYKFCDVTCPKQNQRFAISHSQQAFRRHTGRHTKGRTESKSMRVSDIFYCFIRNRKLCGIGFDMPHYIIDYDPDSISIQDQVILP